MCHFCHRGKCKGENFVTHELVRLAGKGEFERVSPSPLIDTHIKVPISSVVKSPLPMRYAILQDIASRVISFDDTTPALSNAFPVA